jgi:hypothetical protein
MGLTRKDLIVCAVLGAAATRLKGTGRHATLCALIALVIRRLAARRNTNKHPSLVHVPVLGNSLSLLSEVQKRPTHLVLELARANGFKNFAMHWFGGLKYVTCANVVQFNSIQASKQSVKQSINTSIFINQSSNLNTSLHQYIHQYINA